MSLKSLKLSNFQSHENTELIFDPGINAIIGSSDSGKSSILRSLRWAVYNRPSGNAFVSYWAKDQKGKQKGITIVNVHKDNKYIQRFRDKNGKNGYDINGRQLEAIRTDVPEQIKDFFNLSEVNIQSQMDAPFLLSNTPGEVARFFNRIIKLDEIDQALSLIDSKKRSCNNDIKQLTSDEETQEKELLTFKWIDKTEPIIKKAEEIEANILRYTGDLDLLRVSVGVYKENLSIVEKSTLYVKLEDNIKEIERIQVEIDGKKDILYNLLTTGAEFDSKSKIIKHYDSIIKIESSVDRAVKLSGKYEEARLMLQNYKKSLQDYKELNEKISTVDKELKELKDKMPNTCPVCGNPMEVK